MVRRKQVHVAARWHLEDATDISTYSPISLIQFQENIFKYATTAPIKPLPIHTPIILRFFIVFFSTSRQIPA
jgi:hypothetical protein